MPTKAVILMVGIPGSGKSTIAEKEANYHEANGYTAAVISRDAIRFSMMKDGQGYFDNEKQVFNEFIKQINEAMEIGIDYVIVDATHVSEFSRKKVLSRLLPDPSTKLIICEVHCSLEVALNRNRKREGLTRVSDRVIRNMNRLYTDPIYDARPLNKYGFKGIYLTIMEGDGDIYGRSCEYICYE